MQFKVGNPFSGSSESNINNQEKLESCKTYLDLSREIQNAYITVFSVEKNRSNPGFNLEIEKLKKIIVSRLFGNEAVDAGVVDQVREVLEQNKNSFLESMSLNSQQILSEQLTKLKYPKFTKDLLNKLDQQTNAALMEHAKKP